jgi:hypothetical protein
MDGYDARVFKSSNDLSFAKHASRDIRIELSRIQNFYRDLSIKFGIFSKIDGTHTASRKLFNQAVLRRAEIRIVSNGPQMLELTV